MRVNRGISIIGAVFTLLILGVFGITMMSLVATEQETMIRSIEKTQAFYLTQTGLEFAIREINQGGYPVVTGKQFENGRFSTTIEPATHTIGVTGAIGDVVESHTITYPQLAGDCFELNNESAVLTGPEKAILKGVAFRKTCLNAITLDSMQLTWVPKNGGEHVLLVIVDGNTLYQATPGAISGEIFELTNYTISNGSVHQTNEIRFSSNMVDKDLTMTWYFTDTSSKTMTFRLLPGGGG